MNIQNRIKKLEDSGKSIEAGKNCGCPSYIVIEPGDNDERAKLCPVCIKNAETVVILPSLDAMPQELETSMAKSQNIRQQISDANSYYGNLLLLNDGDKAATEKITLEKNQALRDLNKQLIVNEFNTQKQIAEKEKQILDQRRKAFIDFKKILISESQFNLDIKAFDVSRAQAGFNELIDLTNKSYAEISRLSIESYQLQLQEQGLSKEERFNLTRQMYLDEQKLAEDNRRAILDIQKNQYQEEARLITQAADFMRSSADVRANINSRLVQEFNEGWNFAFPDFLENFSSQLIQETDVVINSLQNKINAAKEDLLYLKTFPRCRY